MFSKLLAHLEKRPSPKREHVKRATTSIYDTPLESLAIRLNKPYHLLHQGNCEHFLVFDQIRLHHPSDPPVIHTNSAEAASTDASTPYPLTLQITPPLLQLCRACLKAPALLSIVGDIRLGESPCMLCRVCWRAMGDGDEEVIVAPLPSYEIGW